MPSLSPLPVTTGRRGGRRITTPAARHPPPPAVSRRQARAASRRAAPGASRRPAATGGFSAAGTASFPAAGTGSFPAAGTGSFPAGGAAAGTAGCRLGRTSAQGFPPVSVRAAGRRRRSAPGWPASRRTTRTGTEAPGPAPAGVGATDGMWRRPGSRAGTGMSRSRGPPARRRGRGAPRGRRPGGLQVPVRAAGERPGVRVAAAADQRPGSPGFDAARGKWQHIASRAQDPKALTLDELYPAQFELNGGSFTRAAASGEQGLHAGGLRLGPAAGAGNRQVHPVVRASYVSGDGTMMGTVGVVNLNSSTDAQAGQVTGPQRDYRAARRQEGADEEDRYRDRRRPGRDQGPLPDLEIGRAHEPEVTVESGAAAGPRAVRREPRHRQCQHRPQQQDADRQAASGGRVRTVRVAAARAASSSSAG